MRVDTSPSPFVLSQSPLVFHLICLVFCLEACLTLPLTNKGVNQLYVGKRLCWCNKRLSVLRVVINITRMYARVCKEGEERYLNRDEPCREKVGHFFVQGLWLKTEGIKISKSSGHFDCGERYSKRSRTIAKPEHKHKHDYTNAMFKHVFVILCARVWKHNFRTQLQQLNIYFKWKILTVSKYIRNNCSLRWREKIGRLSKKQKTKQNKNLAKTSSLC